MNPIRSRTTRAIAVAFVAGSLALTGCSEGSKDKKDDKTVGQENAKEQQEALTFATAEESTGPAEPVKGAQQGGTLTVYSQDDVSHLDPGQIYVSDAGLLSTILHRGLTANRVNNDGTKQVAGDLATDTGLTEDGGKTWKYTLKDGITDEDGDPITSKDVRHTFERQFAPFITDGPSYIQQWLAGSGTDYRKALPDGPFKGKHLPDTILETPDDKTVIFHLQSAQPDFPQALAMAGYAIVPEKKDTKEKYDKAPKALGPYKIGEYKPGKSLTLVKNDKWDPATDSVRRQMVDKFYIEFNHDPGDIDKHIMSDRGVDQAAIAFTGGIDTSNVPTVTKDKAMMARTIQGYQPYVWQLNMNMDRIKDKKVRDAITYAIPNGELVRIDGGSYGGEIAGGLLAPTLPGFEAKYDPFNKLKKPTGDIEKAKQLLKEAGKVGMELKYAYANTPIRQEQAVVIENALTEAGFKVSKQEKDQATWYEQMGKIKNGLDLYMTGWGQDWASPGTVIPPSYDGTQIQDGASNYSHINDPKVNSEIKRISAITDPAKASDEWNKLHHYIVEQVNPAVPLYFTKQFMIQGSKVGGAEYNSFTSYYDWNKLYVKK
ncbi:Oligopeptide-binding protein OppA [Streptomyces sp. RB5]|uniref:Oligopeptide-binding protein OppA n=1 Tax=Streptomyces smaragdinus TaxID=2585196 RepID=A0A7K0CT79_9ACTN|nr:ABC transporter substrate-binding protein [Streptomyces smaragdinus]MQY16661.1 Oligopeptide-binding protein OppA [Streptomyces smaragdinus]